MAIESVNVIATTPTVADIAVGSAGGQEITSRSPGITSEAPPVAFTCPPTESTSDVGVILAMCGVALAARALRWGWNRRKAGG
jgi:hypothetical protein